MPRKKRVTPKSEPQPVRVKRRPSWVMVMRHRETGVDSHIGAGWDHERDSGISLRLNRGVAIDWRDFWDGGEYVINLWPIDE